jgi:RNA polymerase sigma-70 factor (ECF subfamily)
LGERHREAEEPERQDDGQFVAGIAARDLRAFEALYRAYRPRLARFLMNLLHRPPLVEEVLDDTLKALRRQEDPLEDRDAHLRISPEAGPEERIDEQRVQQVLLGAMGRLSADHRAVVDLTYFHGMGYREIAEIMDCPVDTVKTRMFHARRHLKRLLAGELADWL